MRISGQSAAALLAAVGLTAVVGHAASDASGPPRAFAVAEHRGLVMRIDMVAGSDRLAVETRVENRGAEPVELEQDGCGLVTRAMMVRTLFAPKGRT